MITGKAFINGGSFFCIYPVGVFPIGKIMLILAPANQ